VWVVPNTHLGAMREHRDQLSEALKRDDRADFALVGEHAGSSQTRQTVDSAAIEYLPNIPESHITRPHHRISNRRDSASVVCQDHV